VESGKITNISVKPTSSGADSTKAATVTFEKETAAKTALLLDNTQLGPSQVQVTSGANLEQISRQPPSGAAAHEDDENIAQEDKPRSRIVAEYLAHGYVLSDQALTRALDLDKQHGISNRFTAALQKYDEKYRVTDKAKSVDQSYGVSNRGMQAWAGLNSYFEKAINTPQGQKLVDFYSKGNRQVMDIHNEARRLADLKSGKGSSTNTKEQNEESKREVSGTGKTVCQCGGNDGTCACKDGQCDCSGCSKGSVAGENTATGKADTIASTAGIQPLPGSTSEKSS